MRDQIAQGKYRNARDTLWQAEYDTKNGGTLMDVQEFISLATELQTHLAGGAHEECGRYITRAERRIEELAGQQAIYGDAVAVLRGCSVLGGHGLPVRVGQVLNLLFTDLAIYILTKEGREPLVAYKDVIALEIGGPGQTQSGGGYIGGGFGLQGAAEGMLIASALNMLTTKTRVDTVICVQAKSSELFLHTSAAVPNQLRMQLSAVFTSVRQANSQKSAPVQLPASSEHAVDRLAKLAELLDRGLIDEGEFRRLKADILGSP